MHNINFNSGYNISPTRLQTLNTPEAIVWPSIMHALAKISLALDNYQQNPENNQVRGTFIQTVNHVLKTNAIIREYFEEAKGRGFYLAKIFKAKPSSWGQSNSYVAERLAKISQLLIVKYDVKNFIQQGFQPKLDSKFQLYKLQKSLVALDFSDYNKNKLFLNKHANQKLSLGFKFLSNVPLRNQIQRLAKYNFGAVQRAQITFLISNDPISLKTDQLGAVLQYKLPNLTSLTFKVETFKGHSYLTQNEKNRCYQSMLFFWKQTRQHKHLKTLIIDLAKDSIPDHHQLKIAAIGLKYLKNLTNLNIKIKNSPYVSDEDISYVMQGVKWLTKLSTLNFQRLAKYNDRNYSRSNYPFSNNMDPILGTLSLLSNLTQLVVNVQQLNPSSQNLLRLSNRILTLPKLAELVIHMEAFMIEQGGEINSQTLAQFIANLNLSTSLTKLRLVMPEHANTTISLIKTLFHLKDSIKLELQVKHDVQLLKSIADSANKLVPSIHSLRNLMNLSIVMDVENHNKACNVLKLPRNKLENFYYQSLQQTFKYCNYLPVLQLNLVIHEYINDYTLLDTYLTTIKALGTLSHLEELEIVVPKYSEDSSFEGEFLSILNQTVNNLKKLTTFKLTFVYIYSRDYESDLIYNPPPRATPFISFISGLKRLPRFKLAVYQLDPKSVGLLASSFRNYIDLIKTTPSANRSWYTLIASENKINNFPSQKDKVLNYYF
jgi:hypothetical protein